MIIQICPHLIFHWKIACHSCSKILKFLLKRFYWQFKVIFPHHKMLNCLYWLHCCFGFLHCCLDFLYVGDIAWKRSLSVINFVFSLFRDNYIKCQAPGSKCQLQWSSLHLKQIKQKEKHVVGLSLSSEIFLLFSENLFILKNQTIDSKQCIGFSCLYSMKMYMF